MRRLDIALFGHSPALAELATELQQHGHGVHHHRTAQPLERAVDLLIDDGSLSVLPDAGRTAIRLSVRVDLAAPDQIELFYRCAERIVLRQPLAPEISGNGQALRLRAISSVVETCAGLVSHFSRDADYFDTLPALPDVALNLSGLQALEPLAFVHRHNQRAMPALLDAAEVPVMRRISDSLQRHAGRPALCVDGVYSDYAQLQVLSLSLQQQMLEIVPFEWPMDRPLVIGLCLGKSATLYAAILAVLGCGAVYLPLDPQHPAERRRYILQNAGAALLLHDGDLSPDDLELPTLDVRQVHAWPIDPSTSLMRREVAPDDPCVAIYTSGTTGRPKGVLLSQRNISHFCAWYSGHVGLTARSRALQFSTINFDASLLDILPTFIAGALLVVPSEDQRRDPPQLVTLMQQEQVSHAFLPPALLSILPLETPLGLAHLITGGDVCEPYVIEQLIKQCRVHNIYGPTETTVLATTRQFEAGDSNRHLGLPIANSKVLILDEQDQPVPQHTPGELYIAGPGVGLGYLNDPELSAKRYGSLTLPDGEVLRVYRTGDIGQWTDSGIEIAGRRDNQVKIRGFRVEPEEIEHCLRTSQLYRQVAVVVDEQRRILAFLVQPEDARPDAARQALREHVQRRLPNYMHPSAYVELPRLPFTSNGKVDRRALLSLPNGPRTVARRLPANAVEQRLLLLWAALLELPVEDISTDESFFNLGGHSILLSRLLLSIREEFGRSLSINRFIEAPTLITLAQLLSDEGASPGALSAQAFIDANIELDIEPLPISQMGDVHKVLVTGANSFLGVHIVEALLAWGASEVVCLVRESGGYSAAERFAQSLRENRLEHLDLSRVTVYAADITQPQLGLPNAVYERIDREFGALVHNAANVNHVLDYESLARDNVEPIFECLRLCEGRSKKIFNFVSTLSASSSLSADGRVLEQPAAQTPPIYIKNGYNLSKWVGERILERARALGVRVNLYRPGNISFNSLTGVCQPHKNRLMLMLKGSIQLGQVPELALNFDLMPVDFLARFIAFHSSRYQPDHAVFNLHNPEPLSWEAYMASFRESGRQFHMVSIADWQRQLVRVDSDNALFGVLGFYLNGFEEDIGDISMIGHDNARAGVQRMGAHYPAKSPALLRRGCDYLKAINFI